MVDVKKFLSVLCVAAFGVVLAGCGGSGSNLAPTAPTVSSIAVSPASATVALPGTQALTTTATLSDGTTKDVTSTATYASSDATVATVSTAGVVTSVKAGSATITATASGKTATSTITVSPPTVSAIAVTPATVTLALPGTQALIVTATLSDGTTQDVTSSATYASSSGTVATVSTAGLVTSVKAGSTTITATASGKTATSTVTVDCCVGAAAYQLMASDFIRYSAQTNGAYLHSSQGGNVISFYSASGYSYGCYDNNQSGITYIGYYLLQVQAGGTAGCGAPPSTYNAATDFAGLVFLAPPGSGGTPHIDISQAGDLLIRMGNTFSPSGSGGHASVFTVEMSNAVNGTATDVCSKDVTLTAVGAGPLSQNGVNNYQLPLSGFTCSSGTLADLKTTGVTQVAVKIAGTKNPGIVNGDFDTIGVSYVGFTYDGLGAVAPATPSGYGLLASDFVAGGATNPAGIGYSVQLGDVIPFYSSGYAYGCYNSDQSGINYIGHILLQVQAGGTAGCGGAPSAYNPATDYTGIVLQGPSSAPNVAVPIDISQSTAMLIRMGNTFTTSGSGGHASVFTVEMSNTVSLIACDADVTLTTVGAGAISQNGLIGYQLPFSGFTCSGGTMADLKLVGVTQAAIKIVSSKNPSVVRGDFDTIAVSYVGFTH